MCFDLHEPQYIVSENKQDEYIHVLRALTAEKWFAGGESNVFRLSSDCVNGLSEIMITSGRLLGGKDF
jgi:hypothetical protein